VCFASHMTQGSARKRQLQSRFYQTSSNSDSLSRLGKKREWVCIFDSSCVCSLSFALTLAVRKWLVRYFQKMEVLSNWARVVLHCWFPASSRFHLEHVQTISVCYTNGSGSKSETIVQCSACHSISVFTFYLLYCRKFILTRLYFQTYFYCEIFQCGKSFFTD